MTVIVSPDGKKVYVSAGRGGIVCVVERILTRVLNTIKVGVRPWRIALSPDGKFLFAANGPSDYIPMIDLATAKEIRASNRPAARRRAGREKICAIRFLSRIRLTGCVSNI